MSTMVRWMFSALIVLAFAVPDVRWVAAQTPSSLPAPEQPGQQETTPEDPASEIELTRAAIQVRRQAIVTSVMDLQPREADAFWPLYREYRLEMAKVNDRLVKLIVRYGESYDTLSDEQAARMLDEALAIEKARTNVKTKHVSRFRKVMPARKVARFFQADNKLDVLIAADLAAVIPLAK
jgi:hypothetical protein